MRVAIHDSAGRINQLLCEPISPDYLVLLSERGIAFAETDETIDDVEIYERHYVAGGKLVPRPAFPAAIDKTEIRADGIDRAVITRLPQPCTLLVDGVPVERKAGTLTLTSDMPADYRISADHWPFLPWQITVRAR